MLAIQRELMVATIGFVKTGVPPETWPLFNFNGDCCTCALDNYNVMHITGNSSSVEQGESDVARRMEFWDKLSADNNLQLVDGLLDTQGQCLPNCPRRLG
jgi:hypothetical protein